MHDTVSFANYWELLDPDGQRTNCAGQPDSDSARAWLESGVEVTLRAYTRRYGVDRHTAYDELTMLGITLPAKDEQWAVYQPPKRSRADEHESDRVGGGVPYGWCGWSGASELTFVTGFTSGGAPFGLRADEFPPEDLPEELKPRERSSGAFIDDASPRRDDWREAADWEAGDHRDVPF